MKLFLRAVRAPFFTATLVPVFLGGVVAATIGPRNDHFDPILFLLVLIGGISFHASANVLNDYFDYKGGTDNINIYHNPFSGGSRLIQDGIFTPKKTLILGLTFLMMGAAIGICLVFLTGPLLLVFGIAGTLFILIYSIDRIGLSYIGRGLGELTIAISFGPLILLGTCYVMAGRLYLSAFWLSLPVALLIALILLVNGYPDYDADKATNKYTLVVTLGKGRTRYLYASMLLSTYLFIIIGVVLNIIPIWTLISLLTLPMAIMAIVRLFKVFDDPREVVSVCGMTVGIHFITGILLVIGVGISLLQL